MARIKKKGLDYFPMNTDFIQNRLVRRIMKSEGDASIAVLLEALSYIYAGEGYYVIADRLFYEDLSASLYDVSTESVRRIIGLAVEYGLFDADLFAKHAVLSSAEIQRQYLFSTKRRIAWQLETEYCLLPEEEIEAMQCKKKAKVDKHSAKEEVKENVSCDENVTFIPQNVTSGTHSIAKHSIAQQSRAENITAEQSKKYPPQYSSVGGEQETKREKEEERGEKREEISFEKPEGGYRALPKEWTAETLRALRPPVDGMKRNYEGLLFNLGEYGIPPAEQYAIIRGSNFGALDGAVWKGFTALRESKGKIKLPGRYLLSVVSK